MTAMALYFMLKKLKLIELSTYYTIKLQVPLFHCFLKYFLCERNYFE